MNDPKRLREPGADRFTALLLESGRCDAPAKARLDRMLSGLVAAGLTASAKASVASTAALAAMPVAAKSAVPIAMVVKWIALGALAGATISAAALRLELQPRTDSGNTVAPPSSPVAPELGQSEERSGNSAAVGPSPPSDPATRELARPTRAENRVDQPSRDTSSAASKPSPGVVAKQAPAPRTRSALPSPEAPLDTAALREEVAALGLAKAALNRGAPAVALDAVRAYRARYPAGRLAPEAAYIEMEAELSLGNRQRATAIAKQLASGASPNAERARAILRGAEP